MRFARAGKVATDIQQIDVVDEVRKGLVGLEAINRELSKPSIVSKRSLPRQRRWRMSSRRS